MWVAVILLLIAIFFLVVAVVSSNYFLKVWSNLAELSGEELIIFSNIFNAAVGFTYIICIIMGFFVANKSNNGFIALLANKISGNRGIRCLECLRDRKWLKKLKLCTGLRKLKLPTAHIISLTNIIKLLAYKRPPTLNNTNKKPKPITKIAIWLLKWLLNILQVIYIILLNLIIIFYTAKTMVGTKSVAQLKQITPVVFMAISIIILMVTIVFLYITIKSNIEKQIKL